MRTSKSESSLLRGRTQTRNPATKKATHFLRYYRNQLRRFRRRLANSDPKQLALLSFLFSFSLLSFLVYFLFSSTSSHSPLTSFRFQSSSSTQQNSQPDGLSSPIVHVSTQNIDIVPQEPVFLSGFASRSIPPSSTELLVGWAPLRARILHLRFPSAVRDEEKSRRRLIFVTLDVVGIDAEFSDSIFDALFQLHGLSRHEVRIICSHTHSGPVISANLFPLVPDYIDSASITRYADYLRNIIVESVGNSLEPSSTTAVPANAYFAIGSASIAVNRRQIVEKLFEGSHGDIDSELPVLFFRSSRKPYKVIAGLYGYAAHATILTINNKYSGDYPSAVSYALEKVYPGSTWLFLPGCGGDLNIYPRGTIERLQHHRDVLVKEIQLILSAKKRDSMLENPAVNSISTSLKLKFRTQLTYASVRAMLRGGKTATTKVAKTLLGNMKSRNRNMTEGYYEKYPMSAWRIFGVNILFLGGEPTVGYAAALRERKEGDGENGNIDWVVGYTDDVMGYVGTEAVLKEGKREGSDRAAQYYGLPCAWDPVVESAIVEKAKRLAKQL